jgi:pilus assembly protein CpaB
MDRRKILLIVAAVIAALGTAVVFLYVRGADNRANLKFAGKQVLVANAAIDPGESLKTAKAAGKFETKTVTAGSLVPGFVTDLAAIPDSDVALTTIYPGEQILRNKFGASGAGASSGLQIPAKQLAVSVNLGDPDRVAGFVNPGDKVAIFLTDSVTGKTRLLLSNVTVIGVGTTTVVATTTKDPTGAQTTEQLPRTLMTLALNQSDSEKMIFASHIKTYIVTFALRSTTSEVAKTAGTTAATLYN